MSRPETGAAGAAAPHSAQVTLPELSCEFFRACQQQRVIRERHGLLYLEGARSLLQARAGGHRPCGLLVSDALMIPAVAGYVRRLRREGVPCLQVGPDEFRAFGLLERASGVAALVPQPWQLLHHQAVRPGDVWIALERVRSLGNLGTLIRSAEAFGASGFIFLDPSIDPFAPQVVRASMGALFHQRFSHCRDRALRHWLRRHRALVIGASPEAEPLSAGLSLRLRRTKRPLVLLLGAEREGMSQAQRELCEQLVSIPMRGQVDSLNLSVAGSVLLYELLTRR